MKLLIVGERVEQFKVDYALTLRTENQANGEGGSLRIKTEFTFWESPTTAPTVFHPATSKEIGMLVPHVRHTIISGAQTDAQGNLLVSFDNGARIEVRPATDREAWSLIYNKRFRTAAAAGGSLTVRYESD